MPLDFNSTLGFSSVETLTKVGFSPTEALLKLFRHFDPPSFRRKRLRRIRSKHESENDEEWDRKKPPHISKVKWREGLAQDERGFTMEFRTVPRKFKIQVGVNQHLNGDDGVQDLDF